MPPLGWLEIVVLAQTVIPALLFIPQLLPLRTQTRMLSFVLPLVAWAAYAASGRRVAGGRTYPPAIYLALAAVWTALSIANPWVNTLASAACSVVITTSVMCPAFWAPAAIVEPRQLRRLLMLLLVCNGASALMGIAQVYQPERFRPPQVAGLGENNIMEGSLTLIADDGRKILRPPGLTDSPGGAAGGGLMCITIGLGLALTQAPLWQRAAGAGLTLVGMTILFYCQVRAVTLTLLLGLFMWAVLLAIRGEVKKLVTLGVLGVVLALGAVGWVVRSGGSSAINRFLSLFEDKATTTYYKNRGGFIEHALMEQLPEYPLGAGPGRIGMSSVYFGNPLAPRDRAILYAETQIEYWVIDGGLPLLVLYLTALVLAVASVVRIALWSPYPEVAYWGGVVFVYTVTLVVGILGGPPFVGPAGVQFWALLGALYGAQERSRVDALKARAAAAS